MEREKSYGSAPHCSSLELGLSVVITYSQELICAILHVFQYLKDFKSLAIAALSQDISMRKLFAPTHNLAATASFSPLVAFLGERPLNGLACYLTSTHVKDGNIFYFYKKLYLSFFKTSHKYYHVVLWGLQLAIVRYYKKHLS